jgi:hypothetical protein
MNAVKETLMMDCEGGCGTRVFSLHRFCLLCAELNRHSNAEERNRSAAAARPEAKQGTHDWQDQPRVMVDQPEGEDPHVFGMLGTFLGMVSGTALLLICSALGALLLGAATHAAFVHGFSLAELGRQLVARLRP